MNVTTNLLVYFIVLVMLVHPSDIVQCVFIQNFSQLFVFDVEETEKEFCCFDWEKNIFGSKDHDSSNTFLSNVGM